MLCPLAGNLPQENRGPSVLTPLLWVMWTIGSSCLGSLDLPDVVLPGRWGGVSVSSEKVGRWEGPRGRQRGELGVSLSCFPLDVLITVVTRMSPTEAQLEAVSG